MILLGLLCAVLLGLIPASIAKNKGHSFGAWWFYGAMIWIIAFPHSLFLKPDTKTVERNAILDGDLKKCPACAELIKSEALVCRYCGLEQKMPEKVAVGGVGVNLESAFEATPENTFITGQKFF